MLVLRYSQGLEILYLARILYSAFKVTQKLYMLQSLLFLNAKTETALTESLENFDSTQNASYARRAFSKIKY